MSMTSDKHLTKIELDLLVRLMKRSLDESPRDSLLILLGIYTGSRASELLNLTWGNIDAGSKSLVINTLKGGNKREIPLKPWLFNALMKFARASSLKDISSQKIFPISRQRLFQIWDKYRPVKKPFHSLRHTFALNIYGKKQDINIVKYALGHKSLASTTVYLDYHYSLNELRRIL